MSTSTTIRTRIHTSARPSEPRSVPVPYRAKLSRSIEQGPGGRRGAPAISTFSVRRCCCCTERVSFSRCCWCARHRRKWWTSICFRLRPRPRRWPHQCTACPTAVRSAIGGIGSSLVVSAWGHSPVIQWVATAVSPLRLAKSHGAQATGHRLGQMDTTLMGTATTATRRRAQTSAHSTGRRSPDSRALQLPLRTYSSQCLSIHSPALSISVVLSLMHFACVCARGRVSHAFCLESGTGRTRTENCRMAPRGGTQLAPTRVVLALQIIDSATRLPIRTAHRPRLHSSAILTLRVRASHKICLFCSHYVIVRSSETGISCTEQVRSAVGAAAATSGVQRTAVVSAGQAVSTRSGGRAATLRPWFLTPTVPEDGVLLPPTAQLRARVVRTQSALQRRVLELRARLQMETLWRVVQVTASVWTHPQQPVLALSAPRLRARSQAFASAGFVPRRSARQMVQCVMMAIRPLPTMCVVWVCAEGPGVQKRQQVARGRPKLLHKMRAAPLCGLPCSSC